jgi:4'-phosphopantetheinyl transferase
VAGRELGARPAALAWTTGQYGKPELAPPWNRLYTSLSHSGDMVAVAISARRAVGVDVQQVMPDLDTVALSARYFAPDEAAHVAAGADAAEQADRFARLWVRKEAVVKAAGARLWSNLAIAVHGTDVVACAGAAGPYRLADVTAPAGYRAAVALTAATPFIVQTVDMSTVDA